MNSCENKNVRSKTHFVITIFKPRDSLCSRQEEQRVVHKSSSLKQLKDKENKYINENPFSKNIFTFNQFPVPCFINLVCTAIKLPLLLILKLNFILMHILFSITQLTKTFLKPHCERILAASCNAVGTRADCILVADWCKRLLLLLFWTTGVVTPQKLLLLTNLKSTFTSKLNKSPARPTSCLQMNLHKCPTQRV